MISDPFDRWKSRLSESTWQTYQAWFPKFLEFAKLSPSQLCELSVQEASDLAAEFYNKLERDGYSSTSCTSGYTAVRSFFAYNGKRLEKMSNKFKGIVQYEARIDLSQKQVFELIGAIGNYRDKGAAGCCFQGGQRDGVVSCLKIKHIATPNWESASVVVFDIPEFVPDKNGKNVNKRKIKYRFAILSDVVKFIKMHLDERVVAGEKLNRETWLFRTRLIKNGKPERIGFSDPRVFPVQSENINVAVKRAAIKIGLQSTVSTGRNKKRSTIHSHIGRRYFKTQMRLSGVDVELRDFMMGHLVGFGGAYDKYGEQEIINAMEQARPRLLLTPEPTTELDRNKQMALMAIKILRLPEQERVKLEQIILQAQSSEELNEALDTFNGGGKK